MESIIKDKVLLDADIREPLFDYPEQYYDKYYDENYLVVGSTHALHAAEHVPSYWGSTGTITKPKSS